MLNIHISLIFILLNLICGRIRKRQGVTCMDPMVENQGRRKIAYRTMDYLVVCMFKMC